MTIFIDLEDKVYGVQITIIRKDLEKFVLVDSDIQIGENILENNGTSWQMHYRKNNHFESIVVLYSITGTPIQNKQILIHLNELYQIKENSIILGNYQAENIPCYFDNTSLCITKNREQILEIPSGWSFFSTYLSSEQKLSDLFSSDVFIRNQEGIIFYKERYHIDTLIANKVYEIYTPIDLQIKIISNKIPVSNSTTLYLPQIWKWLSVSEDTSILNVSKDISNIQITNGIDSFIKNNNLIIEDSISFLQSGKGYMMYI